MLRFVKARMRVQDYLFRLRSFSMEFRTRTRGFKTLELKHNLALVYSNTTISHVSLVGTFNYNLLMTSLFI